jgi:hypothetical protein
MLEKNYKRLESIIVILMVVGIFAMFQPWFVNVVELFSPLAPDTNLGKLYKDDIAPAVLRSGFYIVFLSTIAITILNHYSLEEVERAIEEKGKALTFLLIAFPVISGLSVLVSLANSFGWSAIIWVLSFIFGVALWHWRRWGFVGLILVTIAQLVMVAAGLASLGVALFFTVALIFLLILIWPKRALLS